MESKLSFFLLFTIVSRSSLAHDTPDSCARATNIGTDLATIQYGEDTARDGYVRLVDVIHTEILAVLAASRSKIYTNPKATSLRTEHAHNNSFTALMAGAAPTAEAIQVFQPELVVSVSLIGITTLAQQAIDIIFLGIEAAQGKDYVESQAEIARLADSVQATGSTLIRGLFNRMLNGTTPIPDEAKPVIACIRAQAVSEVASALAAIFEEINILLKALFNLNNNDAIKNYTSEMVAAKKKAADAFDAEVLHKYSVLRNLVVHQYMKEYGIVTGLFIIQSESGNGFV